MKTIKIYISFLVTAGLFLAVSGFLNNKSDDPVKTNKDLINFSHSFHSELAECSDCHSAVATSTSLNDRLLPNHDNCGTCHEVDNENECKTCHANDTYEPLIQTIPDNMIFNHKKHIDQGLSCDNCHKGLDEVDYSFESAELFPPMEQCSGCHNEVKIASNACENCHITTYNLIPQNHKSGDYIRSHKFLAQEVDANCMMCHNNNTCQECHVASSVITETNAADNFYQPYMPSNSIDGSKNQVITKVHDLNYRYYHGIDAKGRTTECQTCHQIETFCSECHQAENSDFAMSGIVPSSHLLPDFKTLGVGTGGGEHAILARRDIESCVSCHDVQGGDPTCIQCHLDSDGIKGTNPKTHAINFMKDENGDWHDSQGSICYNCHTSASPLSSKTDGFCNYCHM